VCRADDEAAAVGLVDEQLGFDGFGDAQLDSSSPGGVITIVLPTANGPRSSIRSTPAFHSGQRSTSAQSRQTAWALALVSTLCSTAHMSPPYSRRRVSDPTAKRKLERSGAVRAARSKARSDRGFDRKRHHV
jgi:hypothetical protein